ncbi:hypothetical protein AXF42_Ash000987 [Apostasia shenzhenica]|uniref:Uncharacterized protein n=1 Tax=Apostasia shenzhenica TaxID=1088818 RepID=A0A2I0ATM0_9ASPA|nr:hypothetical protein AXF42_Ash000987 [Apostasia shenzhenica]
MVDADSQDRFFSALESSSPAASKEGLQTPPYADDAIFICSRPETLCVPAASDPPHDLLPENPPGEERLEIAGGKSFRALPEMKKKSVVCRKRSRCARIGSSVSDSDEEKQGDASRNPNSISETPVSAGNREIGNADLLDVVVKMMLKRPDRMFEETDILEIAAMKGIDFPAPKWWKPGGY